MKYIILVISILLFNFSSHSQAELGKDPVAKKILDEVAKKTKSYNSIRIKFDYSIENKQNDFKETYKGYAFLRKNSYKIIIPTIEMFSNGKTVWTYMKESNEITITEPSPDEASIFNPAKLFTIYEDGYKYLLIGEEIINTKKYSIIDLFPEDVTKSQYSKIRLKINKLQKEIYIIETYGKSGLNHFLTVNKTDYNVKITENLFQFNKDKYPKDIEIIDMRF